MTDEPASRLVKKLKTMPSENTFSQLIHKPLKDYNRICRLSGYFEALRSRKDDFTAKEAALLKVLDEIEEESEPEKIQLLPFPNETCNLDDLISLHALQNMQPVESFDSMGPNDNSDLILWIMKDFIFKLWGLHHFGAAHGNLKPENVLIVEGDCRILESSVTEDDSPSLEWKAPEQILHNSLTKASDMFTFGCILYFCITKGCHPFGGTPEQCIENIKANKADISLVKDYPDAHHLISLLLNPEPELRPKANNVYSHPFFRNARTKVELLRYICVRFNDLEDLQDGLKRKIPMFGNKNWRERLLEFSTTYTFSHEQPFQDFKDVFGPRGSPTFFPTIFMDAMDVALKTTDIFKHHRWFGVGSELLDSHYPLVESNGFRCPFLYDGFGTWQ